MAHIVINQAQINPFENFCFGLRSKETQRQYPKLVNIFLDFILSVNSSINYLLYYLFIGKVRYIGPFITITICKIKYKMS